ncbi:hypothetical protein FOZ63_021232, partial [Perkinsus olseni]
FTTFRDDKRLFMLMEYVNGGELFSHLRKEGRLPNEEARFYAAEIVLAFQYMHSKSGLEKGHVAVELTGVWLAGTGQCTGLNSGYMIADNSWSSHLLVGHLVRRVERNGLDVVYRDLKPENLLIDFE